MKQKDLLILLIPLFLLTVLWVIFNIYHGYVTSTIEDPLTAQIIPIEGKFDEKTIREIKNRQRIEPLFEAQAQTENLTPSPEDEIEILDETATDSAAVEIIPDEEENL